MTTTTKRASTFENLGVEGCLPITSPSPRKMGSLCNWWDLFYFTKKEKKKKKKVEKKEEVSTQ